jgi:hypothetical protein
MLKYNMYNRELHNFHASPNTMRIIGCDGHVASMGRRGMHVKFWWKARRKETIMTTLA